MTKKDYFSDKFVGKVFQISEDTKTKEILVCVYNVAIKITKREWNVLRKEINRFILGGQENGRR